jgi:hypothetical protein
MFGSFSWHCPFKAATPASVLMTDEQSGQNICKKGLPSAQCSSDFGVYENFSKQYAVYKVPTDCILQYISKYAE